MSSQKLTLDSLEENGWTLADDKQHPLGNLQGKALDSYELVVLSGIRNRFGASIKAVTWELPNTPSPASVSLQVLLAPRPVWAAKRK